MPELPEAETIARTLQREMAGAHIATVQVARRDFVHGDPRPLERIAAGRRIAHVHRRAKRVIIDLDDGTELVFRLGMSGRITLHGGDEPLELHTHVVFRFRDRAFELRFKDPRRFGGLWCITPHGQSAGRALGPVGPEPLDLPLGAFREMLKRKRPIKSLLLDQALIAGIGNIYCDESLHRAGVHPESPAQRLSHDEARRLLRAIKNVLRSAIRHEGTTFMDYRTPNGTPGGFALKHRVYHREGKPCRACGKPIVRMQVAQRSTFLCPTCQPLSMREEGT